MSEEAILAFKIAHESFKILIELPFVRHLMTQIVNWMRKCIDIKWEVLVKDENALLKIVEEIY